MKEPFRILDLGAHDGFVTNFIARKCKEAGTLGLHVDAVEANQLAVETFTRRMERDGIPGHCVQDLAENAYRHFQGRSYDAVVAFELIEHAKDVEHFLEDVECMCKPNGRVYISTPNGTFGAGNNPHHLRCWTINDLFDLLRRRGEVHDCLPGPDGVSVVSYTPDEYAHTKPEVAVYTGPGWEPWSPNDIETKGLGGSETAAVRLATALSEAGCRVTVYGEVNPGAVGQVLYKHHGAFDPMERRDLVICSRIPEMFDRKVNARSKILWMHDTDCGSRLTEERAAQVDRVMVLSNWHHAHVAEMYPFLRDKLYVTRNGIEPAYFEQPIDGGSRNPHRAIYSSSPDRGLDLLLEWWPDVRKQVPDAELLYCYSSVYDAVAKSNPVIAAFRKRLNEMSEQPGVKNIGSLNQVQLAQEMMRSGVWLAPSFSTPAGAQFNETFCIGAVEAAAAGCRRVMAQWGALVEREEQPYDMSRWIPASGPGEQPQKEAFVGAIIKAMTEDSAFGPHVPSERALRMDWAEVAADMLASVAG